MYKTLYNPGHIGVWNYGNVACLGSCMIFSSGVSDTSTVLESTP